MSGLDEFMIHNHPHPVRVMWTSDLQAYERMWFTCQDRTGDLLVVTGMGIYPNLGTAEAFAIVNVRGRHTTVRAHRKLGLNRMDMARRTPALRPGRAVPAVADPAGREPVRHRLRHLVVRHQATRCTGCSAGERSSAPGRSPAWPATTGSAGSRAGSTRFGERFEIWPGRLSGHPGPPLGHPRRGGRPRPVERLANTRIQGSGSSSTTTGSGGTTFCTTSATSDGEARRSVVGATASGSSPIPICCCRGRSTWSSPAGRRRR